MEYRSLGASGLKVSVLSFGTGTFGGQGLLFSAWGGSGVDEARRLVDICLDAGVNLFDSADVYSNGASEEILGAAIKGRRDKVLICTASPRSTARAVSSSDPERTSPFARVLVRTSRSSHQWRVAYQRSIGFWPLGQRLGAGQSYSAKPPPEELAESRSQLVNNCHPPARAGWVPRDAAAAGP
jgi:hypothetical protein